MICKHDTVLTDATVKWQGLIWPVVECLKCGARMADLSAEPTRA